MGAVYVVGDVHGHPEVLRSLLRGEGLIGADDAWRGAGSALWLIGDLVDRGPDGIGAIDAVRRWQREAEGAGGAVRSLLGNHDLLILAVARFGASPRSAAGRLFRLNWEANGGRASDLARLTVEHAEWLAALPAMARVGDDLLVHADAPLYLRYGASIEEVNRAIRDVLTSDDPARWDRLFGEFCDRHLFAGRDGEAQAAAFLRRFGGERIVHGHTPIPYLTGQRPANMREPLAYAGGRCLNVDGGIFAGSPGIIVRLQ
jgi:hypothetical protein